VAAVAWTKEDSDVMLKCVLPTTAFCIDQWRADVPRDRVGVDELVGLVSYIFEQVRAKQALV